MINFHIVFLQNALLVLLESDGGENDVVPPVKPAATSTNQDLLDLLGNKICTSRELIIKKLIFSFRIYVEYSLIRLSSYRRTGC